ncbi:hypothetical protein M407DRAFT_7470 [Tulasnella calospora MUT 4182]|uniref:F-box domain-containing protein n=1 Tax=Tulasnella calospora MUT 4182 TaxID=1051891 RepID=A0A0C3M0E9_9AGAM|nr:hypothetical protein M407DRAFT_7470 [Tulasnella calospora MUT 4182]
MRKLQRIELLYFNITSEMYRHLYSLQHLRDISLVGLTVAEMPEDLTGGALPLTKLSIKHCLKEDGESEAARVYRALLCPGLQTLTLDPRTADTVFKYVARNPTLTFPSLLSFNVSPSPEILPNLHSLLAFLRSCPNLSRFVLPANSIPFQGSPSDHGRGFAYHEDAKGCASKIRSIHASADLVRLLLPGRPIGDVEAFLHLESPLPLDESALEPYRCGAVPLKKLSLGAVTWTHNCLEALARLFPDLELLSLRVVGGSLSDWYNDYLGCRIAAFKLLDSFAIVPLDEHDELWEGSETAERERKILAQAEEYGSFITYMCLGQHDIWTKRGDGTWESRFETCE